jgi:hypothetical protein
MSGRLFSPLYLGNSVVVNDAGVEVSTSPTLDIHLVNKMYMDQNIGDESQRVNGEIERLENTIESLDTRLTQTDQALAALDVADVANTLAKPNFIQHIRHIPFDQHTKGFTPLPSTRSGDADDGWYYKKTATTSDVNKVHVYTVANFPTTKTPKFEMKVSDLKLVYAKVDIFHTSNDDPFITIYTKPKESGNAASWYHSKATYMLPQTHSISPDNSHYLLKIAQVGYENLVTMPGTVELNLVKTDDATATRGIMDDNDDILAISFSTNSGAEVGSVEIVLSQVGIISRSVNGPSKHGLYNYSNDSVLLRAMYNDFSTPPTN